MSININDQDAIDKMAAVEGEHWKAQHMTQASAEFSNGFLGAVKKHAKLVASLEEEGEEPEFYGNIIYGDGGWNRYFVRSDGEIFFSSRHTRSQETILKAQEAGFQIA